MKRAWAALTAVAVVVTFAVLLAGGSSDTTAAMLRSSRLTLTCQPAVSGRFSPCSVVDRLDNPAPTGEVDFSGPTGSGFSTDSANDPPGTCQLAPDPQGGVSCTTQYAPIGPGSTTRKDTITAKYKGDAVYAAKTVTASVAVTERPVPTQLSLSCTATITAHPTPCEIDDAGGQGFGDDPPTTGAAKFTSSTGSFSPVLCDFVDTSTPPILSTKCTTTYTPSGTGSPTRNDKVTASYSGDNNWDPKLLTTTVAVRPKVLPPDMSFSCDAGAVVGGYTGTCTVSDFSAPPLNFGDSPIPTGTITFASATGTFDHPTCTLQAQDSGGATTSESCTAKYKPSGTASANRIDKLTAKYGGDFNWAGGTLSTTTPIAAPGLSIQCADTVQGDPTTCSAIDVDAGPFHDSPFPTGAITFNSGHGTFSPTACTLDVTFFGANCSVTYTPSGVGTTSRKDAITGSYPGDAVWSARKLTTTAAVGVHTARAFGVTCTDAVAGGAIGTCTAQDIVGADIGDSDPMAGPVTFASSTGKFKPAACTMQSDPGKSGPGFGVFDCTVTYIPTGVGSPTRADTITATAAKDKFYTNPTKVTESVPVGARTLQFSCNPTVTGEASFCSVTDTWDILTGGDEPLPSGTVTFSGGNGVFSRKSCVLFVFVNTATHKAETCSLEYTPNGHGSLTRSDPITATYGGDTVWSSYVMKAGVLVLPRTPDLSASCETPTGPRQPVTCTVTANPPNESAPSVTGKLTFTVAGGSANGVFTPTTCTLFNDPSFGSSCSVTYTSKSVHTTDTITVSYAQTAAYDAARLTFSTPTGQS